MEVGEFGAAHVSFQKYGIQNFETAQSTIILDPTLSVPRLYPQNLVRKQSGVFV